jgi:hypothetical protein
LASQRQFEGPVLEELLERVRAEVGPDARIVAANRVRKGGVGGFFAKQAFEVLVEAPGDAAVRARPTTPAPPRTIAQTPQTQRTPTAQARAEGRAPATILELADAVSEDERNNIIDLVEERSVSTESRNFAQVLDQFSRSIDATPEELRGHADPASDIDLRDAHRNIPRAPATSPSSLPTAPIEPSDHPADDHDLLTGAPIETFPARIARPSVARSQRPAAPVAQVIDRYETRLSRLGLPAKLIPRGAAPTALKGVLVESLTRLPPPPSVPSGLGVVIAVVGDGASPVPLARDLATDLGLDPDDVVLATREQLGYGIPAWLQMSDGATAQERRRSWGRRARPTIVACSLPPASRGLRWARELLDGLEPTVAWAIVDAGAKREDIVHRVETLGGVDVLALDGLDNTVSPAAVLELGIPVGRLELEHASPLTWTELLLERMSVERVARVSAEDLSAKEMSS